MNTDMNMNIKTFKCAIVAAAFLFIVGPLAAAENLLTNAGFEDGLNGWGVRVKGDWVRKADQSKFVSLSADAATGKQAVTIDTTSLNPEGRITDKLRNRTRRSRYTITVTQNVDGIAPNAWYLVKFRIKSSDVSVQNGLELLCNIKPWPRKHRKDKKVRWNNTGYRTGKVFVPRAVLADGEYHEYVLLKQTYDATESLEVGVSIAEPWTGKIAIDDVELTRIEPDKDMDAMARYLALRGATPITEIRPSNRETMLVRQGSPAAAILIPDSAEFQALADKIQSDVAKLTGATLPVVKTLEAVPAGANIVALGSVVNNDLVARLHFNRYVKIDSASPGPGGYVVWTVVEPYGLTRGQNVIVIGGSDAAGQAAAVETFCAGLKANDKTIELPFLHKVFPKKAYSAEQLQVPTSRRTGKRSWSFRTTFGGFANWFMHKWLETGDLKIAKMTRNELLDVLAKSEKDPYDQTEWSTFEVGLAWDVFDDLPVMSDEERLKFTNLMLGYLCTRPQSTSDWGTSFLLKDTPIWNHQAKGLSGAYTMGRYFERFYGDHDPRFAYFLDAARTAFRSQAAFSKPQENSGNYWQITMKFCIAYYLGEWDMTFFENGALRRYAEYMAGVHNNKGWLSGFGDTYFGYHGATPFDLQKNSWSVPLAFWYYRDAKMLWWLEHVLPDYQNPYHRDIEPVEWTELTGVRILQLARGLYLPYGERNLLWGAGGEYSDMPVGGVKYEQTFDKITLRDGWDPKGQYMCIEGNGRGIHSQRATNQIAKLSILGEDIVIGSTYKGGKGAGTRTYGSVIAVKDANIDDPVAKGKGRFPFQWWSPVVRNNLAYAALETLADLPTSGFVRTSMPKYHANTRWDRSVIWAKGDFFILIDQVTAAEDGNYHLETNFATNPQNRKGASPPLTKRTCKVLDDGRTFETAFQDADATKLYFCGDGTAEMVFDPYQWRCELIFKQVVRQQLVGQKLQAGQTAAFFSLFYGDQADGRKNLRIERISPTEGLIFQGDEPIAYFGLAQSDKTRAIQPVDPGMFLMTFDRLAFVSGAGEGKEITIAAEKSRSVLKRLAELVNQKDSE